MARGESFDYDYDTGSFGRNPVQVTRYRQNIQRFRDYGNVNTPTAPLSEGRFKEGIQPSGSRFQPPSAGVQADFTRDSRMRDPNQPPLDTSAIGSLMYNRMFFGKGNDESDDGNGAQQQSGSSTRQRRSGGASRSRPTTETTYSREGTTTTTTRRGLFGRPRQETTFTPSEPLTTQQQSAVAGVAAQRQERQTQTAEPARQRTPAPRPFEMGPIQRVEPAATQEQRTLTPLQQRAVEAVRQRREAASSTSSVTSPPLQRLDEALNRLRLSPSAQSWITQGAQEQNQRRSSLPETQSPTQSTESPTTAAPKSRAGTRAPRKKQGGIGDWGRQQIAKGWGNIQP